MRCNVYIDGFNLYYGAIRNTELKWLNLRRLCELLLPNYDLRTIRYFTAIVGDTPEDPDKSIRQRLYLRALSTTENLSISLGQFRTRKVRLPLVDPLPDGSKFARVLKIEEKGSDVNLASHLLHDAHRNAYDAAVLISNDSDLVEPLRMVREDIGKMVGVINPHRHRPSMQLISQCDFQRTIREGVLEASQFPQTLSDAIGSFSNPFNRHE